MDGIARSKLAEAARALVAGRITNDQFDERVPCSTDPAIGEIYEKGFWTLYDDLRVHKLVGSRRLDKEQREFAARCIMFLKSGLPYRWPVTSTRRLLLGNLLTLGLYGRLVRRRLLKAGDPTVWPFISQDEYHLALCSPAYLRGPVPN